MTVRVDDPPRLIVNADDYGGYACVSKGILESAIHGIVTATGVFANAPRFGEHAAWLRECEELDAGVHLNLTDGAPLTSDLGRSLLRWSGRFPRKFAMARAILTGEIRLHAVKAEWRAQIERCLEHRLQVRFLNSHEHLHMLPPLFTLAHALARDYGIRHVRFPTTGSGLRFSPAALVRRGMIGVLAAINRRNDSMSARFLGMETSGRLDLKYLQAVVPGLRRGQVYELMCHPGRFDPQEIHEPRLLRYHDWNGELAALTSSAARELLDRCGVKLIGYRHLDAPADRPFSRSEAFGT